jgi:hypothetical protein
MFCGTFGEGVGLIALVKVRTSRGQLHFHQSISVQSYWLHLARILRDAVVDSVTLCSSSQQLRAKNGLVGGKIKTPKSE